MKIIQLFKEPVNKSDLMPVIRQGVFMSIVGGLLIGALHLLIIQVFGFSFLWIMLFIFAFTLARRMHAAYHTYHILYAIIAILTVFITFYLLNVVYYVGLLYMVDSLSITSFSYMLNPLIHFQFFNIFTSGFFSIENLLDVIFFLIVNIYVVRYIK
ncbi:MAG: hypothetical protein KKG64_05105 [Firmicutes bacterium]|nr:hypothetical protein [Bacillota bacterium]